MLSSRPPEHLLKVIACNVFILRRKQNVDCGLHFTVYDFFSHCVSIASGLESVEKCLHNVKLLLTLVNACWSKGKVCSIVISSHNWAEWYLTWALDRWPEPWGNFEGLKYPNMLHHALNFRVILLELSRLMKGQWVLFADNTLRVRVCVQLSSVQGFGAEAPV